MSNSSGIVLQAVDSSFTAAPPKAHPSSIYVVSYKDGHVRSFTGAPSPTDRWGSRYCYIVDTSEHGISKICTVKSAEDAYDFTVEVDATWQVTDAEKVVRAGVSDGNQLVLRYLQDEIWQVSRQFSPQSTTAAEAASRAMLARVGALAQGITVLHAIARFQADNRLTEGRNQLDANALEGQIEDRALARLKRLDGSDEAAIREHMLRHPEDTLTLIKVLSDGKDREQALGVTLLKEGLDRGFITDADAQPLRDMLLGGPAGRRAGGPGVRGSGVMPSVGPRSTLSLPSGVSVTGPAGPAAGAGAAAQGLSLPGVQPSARAPTGSPCARGLSRTPATRPRPRAPVPGRAGCPGPAPPVSSGGPGVAVLPRPRAFSTRETRGRRPGDRKAARNRDRFNG